MTRRRRPWCQILFLLVLLQAPPLHQIWYRWSLFWLCPYSWIFMTKWWWIISELWRSQIWLDAGYFCILVRNLGRILWSLKNQCLEGNGFFLINRINAAKFLMKLWLMGLYLAYPWVCKMVVSHGPNKTFSRIRRKRRCRSATTLDKSCKLISLNYWHKSYTYNKIFAPSGALDFNRNSLF